MQLFNIYIFNVFTSSNDRINFKNKLYAQNLRKKWHELNLVILVPAASQKNSSLADLNDWYTWGLVVLISNLVLRNSSHIFVNLFFKKLGLSKN